MERCVVFTDPCEGAIAESFLKMNGLNYAWKSENRMILDRGGVNLLNEASVDFDEVELSDSN